MACINCNIAIRAQQPFEYEALSLSSELITILEEWTAREVGAEDRICHECFNVLLVEFNNRIEGNIGNRQLGHQSVCVCCGISVSRRSGRRSHILLHDQPERAYIANIIEPRQLKSDGDPYSNDGSEQDNNEDSAATPGDEEVDDLHQTDDAENAQSHGAEGIPCEKKTGRPREPPQVGPDGSAAKRKRGRPKSSSNKIKMKSDDEPFSNDGSEQDKSCTLTEPLRVKCDDSVATPDNGEVDVLHQTGDTEPPQVAAVGSAAKRKRGRPKSSSKKKKSAAQVAVPKEKILQMSKPNQACRIIARVYHYLEQEYESIKANTDKSCDLSFLSNILKRTAGATGFPEPMVKTILEAEEIRKQKPREAAELQHKAEQRKERLQNSVKRKKNKNVKTNSNSEVAKVNIETSSDLATGINSDSLVTSGNVSNEDNSEMAADIDSDPLADTVKTEVLDEEYGDNLLTGIQQSSKPTMAITITAPTARLHHPANKPPHGPPQPAENVSEEPEVYAPLVTDPEELERIEAKPAAEILQALLKTEQDPLG